jgi:predicted RNase H-like nuclease (RuvC/YqgF family)
MNDTMNRIGAVKAKARARKLRIQELNEELENKTQMVEHLEGQL